MILCILLQLSKLVGELQGSYQDVDFLSPRANLCTAFHKDCGRAEGLGNATCL